MYKIKDNIDLKNKLEVFVKELEYGIEFSKVDDTSRYDKLYGLCIENVLKLMEEFELIEKKL